MSNKLQIDKFKQYLTEDLQMKYGFTEFEAKEIVQKSAINKLLDRNPEYVMHYTINYWVDVLWKECHGLPTED